MNSWLLPVIKRLVPATWAGPAEPAGPAGWMWPGHPSGNASNGFATPAAAPSIWGTLWQPQHIFFREPQCLGNLVMFLDI